MMKTNEQRIQELRERFRRLQEASDELYSAEIDKLRAERKAIAERYRKRFATIRSAS